MNKVRLFFLIIFLNIMVILKFLLGIVVFEAGGDSGVFEINIMNDLCNERFMKYLQLTLSVPGKIKYYVYYTYICVHIYFVHLCIYIYMYTCTSIHIYTYAYI
jgi:hypothetical protein